MVGVWIAYSDSSSSICLIICRYLKISITFSGFKTGIFLVLWGSKIIVRIILYLKKMLILPPCFCIGKYIWERRNVVRKNASHYTKTIQMQSIISSIWLVSFFRLKIKNTWFLHICLIEIVFVLCSVYFECTTQQQYNAAERIPVHVWYILSCVLHNWP